MGLLRGRRGRRTALLRQGGGGTGQPSPECAQAIVGARSGHLVLPCPVHLSHPPAWIHSFAQSKSTSIDKQGSRLSSSFCLEAGLGRVLRTTPAGGTAGPSTQVPSSHSPSRLPKMLSEGADQQVSLQMGSKMTALDFEGEGKHVRRQNYGQVVCRGAPQGSSEIATPEMGTQALLSLSHPASPGPFPLQQAPLRGRGTRAGRWTAGSWAAGPRHISLSGGPAPPSQVSLQSSGPFPCLGGHKCWGLFGFSTRSKQQPLTKCTFPVVPYWHSWTPPLPASPQPSKRRDGRFLNLGACAWAGPRLGLFPGR